MCHVPHRVVGLCVVIAALALAPYPSSPSVAGCVAPQLSIGGDQSSREHRIELRRGDQVTVDGRFFHEGCDDTGGGDAFGCSADEPEQEIPLDDVELLLLENPASTNEIGLGITDADDESRTSWTFTVPLDVPVGRAVLRAAFSDPLYVVIA
jgi:hypothetical protein